MKNRFLKVLISMLLVVSMLFSLALTTACTGGGNNSSSSSSQEEEPPLPNDTPEDRTGYSADVLLTAVTSSYLKDFVPESDGSLPAFSLLDGYLVGDVYTAIANYAIDYVRENVPLLANTVDMMDLVLYRGIDGKWYRICYSGKDTAGVAVYENVKVNPVLNEVLNYNLDGSGTLNVNYAGYGGKTLGYILFEYNEPTGTTYDRDFILSSFINGYPVVKAVLNTTVNELKTIVEGTSSERSEILLKNFGGLTVGDFLAELAPSTNGATDAIYKVTINQLYDLSQVSDKSAFYAKLAEIFKGVTIGNIVGVVEGDADYISNIHTMTLAGIFDALSKDGLSDYLLKEEYIGGLSVDKLVRYFVTDENALAQYEAVYANAKDLLDLKVNVVISGYKAGEEAIVNGINAILEEVKDVVIYNDITISTLMGMIEDCTQKDAEGNVIGFDFETFIQTIYGSFSPADESESLDIQAILQNVYEQYLKPAGITKESVIAYINDNYADIMATINGIISETEGFDFATKFKELAEKELSAVLEELKGKLSEESADIEAVISEFIATYDEVLVNILKDYGKYGDEISALITANTTDGVVDYKAVLESALGLYAYDLTAFAVNEAISYLENLKLDVDVQIKAFTDSEGNVLDVTVNELLTLAIEELKMATGEESDPNGALKAMLGDAKVSTLIELISSLFQSTVTPN